jgi:16S rRNA (cytidine1402-2'-O)-methyltransferase
LSPRGRLVVVATPIGNLGDLSPRAVTALEEADLVCCEDTRRTRRLLSHAGVSGRNLLSLHEHNEATRTEEVVARLRAGQTVAIVSDAGTPLVSDPGSRLVTRAASDGFEVTTVPGPSAAIAALVVSGLPTDRFCFDGFLPRRGTQRRMRIAEIGSETRTVVLFESPLRVVQTLTDLERACGAQRRVAIARELTKLHEEVWRGTLGEARAHFEDRELRGEVVVVIGGSTTPPAVSATDEEILEALRGQMSSGESAKDAAGSVSKELGVPRRRAYSLATGLRDEPTSRPARSDS